MTTAGPSATDVENPPAPGTTPAGPKRPREDADRTPPPEAADHTPGVVALAVGLVGIALIPWLLRLPPQQALLCLAQVGIAAAGAARAAYPAVRPIALVAFVFTFSWIGIAPIYQLAHGRAAWQDSGVLFGPRTTTALILMVVATAALYLGFYGLGDTRERRRPRPFRPVGLPPRSLCMSYVAVSLLLTPAAVAASGGLANMFSSRADRSAALGAAGITLAQVGGAQLALVGILPGALATAGCFLALHRVLDQLRRKGLGQVEALDAGIFVVGFALVVLHVNPFISTRAATAAAFGSLALLALRPRSRRAGALMLTGLLVATLVVYPAANVFRGTSQADRSEGFEFLATLDFDGFQQAINTVEFVEDTGHSAGSYSLSGALYFVPRAYWTGKEQPASIDVATHRGYRFTNLSLPFHAEMYLDFGPIGMAVVLFLLASMARRADLDWSSGASSRAALLAPYASVACLSVIRGPVGAGGPVYLTVFGLIAVGLLLARTRSPEGIGADPPIGDHQSGGAGARQHSAAPDGAR